MYYAFYTTLVKSDSLLTIMSTSLGICIIFFIEPQK
jgi:hypothetical protein